MNGKGERAELKGLRLGIIRKSMVVPPGSMTEVPIVSAATREIKSILGDHLGATLVESTHPLWTPDPEIETMKTDFCRALARLVPVLMPDLLFRTRPQGPAAVRGVRRRHRADRVRPRQGVRLGLNEADRLLRRAGGRAERTAQKFRPCHDPEQELAMTFRFQIHQ